MNETNTALEPTAFGGGDGDRTMKWSAIHGRLTALDDDALVRVATAAARAVLPVWMEGVPSAMHTAALKAMAALDEWTSTGRVPRDIKDIATEAYGAVGTSGLPPSEARRAGLAAAHAAFALHFWTLRSHDKVFAAARDATENALAASDDPGLADRSFHLTS
jgi:hypothetical protein